MNVKKILIFVLLATLISAYSFETAELKTVKSNLKFNISGTSTIHGWDMSGHGGNCTAQFHYDASGAITGINDISFSFPAVNLKSGKSEMDKRAHKALKVGRHSNITGRFVDAKVVTNDNINFRINSVIKLQIGGVTKDVPVVANGKLNKDKSLTVSGEKKIDMTEFNIEQPSFMFGSVKAGKDVVVKFDLTMN